MQGSHVLVVDRSNGRQVVIARGLLLRQINKDGTHFLIKTLRKGYSLNEVISLETLENCLLFDTVEDLNAFMQENRPPALEAPKPSDPPPPVDNQHVAEGCEQFAAGPSDAPIELFPAI